MARPTYPSDLQDQFMLRMPAGMRERLKDAAKDNGRSLNAEIVLRLEGGIERTEDGRVSVWLPDELLQRVFEEAEWRKSDLETIILEAVENAFPYVPTFGEYVQSVRADVESDGSEAPEALREHLAETERLLRESPEFAERRVRLPRRPIYVKEG